MAFSQNMHVIAGRVRRTETRRSFELDGSMLLTLVTVLLYALTIGFVVYAALNDPGGGIFADTIFMGR